VNEYWLNGMGEAIISADEGEGETTRVRPFCGLKSLFSQLWDRITINSFPQGKQCLEGMERRARRGIFLHSGGRFAKGLRGPGDKELDSRP